MYNIFLIIDAYSILYRAYSVNLDLQNSKNQNIGGLINFINIFNNILKLVKPSHLIICFDTSKNTFRNDIYKHYKENRIYTENEYIYTRYNDIKHILNLINVKYDNVYFYEGDDICGSYNHISKAMNNYIYSGDKDMLQLINNNTNIIFPITGSSNIKIYNKQQVLNEYNISIKQYIDYKCLIGDKSDNIPGVKNCGELTAKKLLIKYGNINNIYKNINDNNKKIKNWKSIKKNLIEYKPNYNLYKTLVTIKKDVKLKYTFKDCKLNINWKNAIDYFKSLELNQIINRINKGDFYENEY